MKILLFAVLALLLFAACRPKKTGISNVADWLEKHYPGRFTVVETQIEDPIRNLSFKVKKSVVAETSNPAVQALLRWDKRDPGLGLTAGAVDSAFAKASREHEDCKTLLEALRAAGFERVSAGIYRGTAEALVFEEPTPECRRQVLERLQKALKAWPPAAQYGLHAALLEPDAYRTEFEDLVPLRHWEWGNYWQKRKVNFDLSLEPGESLSSKNVWTFNTQSDRLIRYLQQARTLAQAWAEKNLDRSAVLLPDGDEYSSEGCGGTLLQFKFPYTSSGGQNAEGYVTGDFQIDQEKFTNIRKTAKDPD